MKNLKFLFSIIISGILLIPQLQAQTQSYTSTEDSQITVKGTSTLHDWEMKSETLMSEVVFNTEDGEQLESLESVTLVLQANSLEADQGRLERLAHETLNVEDHPEISYRSNGGTIRANGNEYEVTSTGELTISGVTQQVSVEATCIQGENNIVCAGTKELLMTDYGLEPPRLFLGTLVTDDEVTVEFRVTYAR